MEKINGNGVKEKTPGYLYMLFAICFIGGAAGGTSSTIMSSSLPVAVKDLLGTVSHQKTEEVSAIINAAFLFGMVFGGILFGFMGDRFGRKNTVVLSIGCTGLFSLLTAFAPGWVSVTVCRFLSGFGTGGVLVTTAILIAEEWTDRNRNVALGILSICFPVGIFSAGAIIYSGSGWRSGFYSGIFPLLIAFVAHFTLRESGKWKKEIIAETDQEKKNSIFDSSVRYDLITGCIIYGSMLVGLWAVFAWLPAWVQSIIHDSDGQKERGASMMLFAAGGLTGGFFSGWISKYIGIKKTMVICFAGCFILCFLMFRLEQSLTLFSYIKMALIALFFGISQGALNVYIPELFPASIRSSATGFCFNIGRVFTASAVFFVGWLVNMLGGYGQALFIFSFVFLIGLIATFFARQKNLIQS